MTPPAGSPGIGLMSELSCPVSRHDALVTASCNGIEPCGAVVAADGVLWWCGTNASAETPRPLASLPDDFAQSTAPLTVWTAAGIDLSVVFAAPSSGRILEFRRQGDLLKPVGELPLPSREPWNGLWKALAVFRDRSLIAIAAPEARENTHTTFV